MGSGRRQSARRLRARVSAVTLSRAPRVLIIRRRSMDLGSDHLGTNIGLMDSSLTPRTPVP